MMCASSTHAVFHYVISGHIQKISAARHTESAKMTINDSWKRANGHAEYFPMVLRGRALSVNVMTLHIFATPRKCLVHHTLSLPF